MIAKRTTAALTVCTTASSPIPAGRSYGSVGTRRAAAGGRRGWASAHHPRKVTK
ncbi:hypothetical protein [Streptosporangium sp. 'caverna']|uniref:hypothetical protein n=1 Tax=Streptosporangium sp. 'caverna' TaxID=2202249 RepID=UPI0013A6A842|nr:hypothetical protein [Streptosporangium sp. 'caverna']